MRWKCPDIRGALRWRFARLADRLGLGRIADRAHVDERARQERADQLDVDREAAAHAAADHALHDLALLERFLEARPRTRALGLLARQTRLAEAVLDGV